MGVPRLMVACQTYQSIITENNARHENQCYLCERFIWNILLFNTFRFHMMLIAMI
ncbi:unnamed protein product [Brugia timori]|uniref:Uncharacterized protein n=1 Tax=Brugia timori TaxID=42155 RepID=A0A3P7TYW3_9BILA|nr:unnamed protein product [Brugia timori]